MYIHKIMILYVKGNRALSFRVLQLDNIHGQSDGIIRITP